MIAILAALSFFFVAADGQFDVCRLDDEYKSVFEDFHRNARRLTWRDGIDQHAKEELLRPGSKTGEESPYIKVEGERHFAEDDQTPLTVKLSLALRKLIRGLARQIKKFSHGTEYGCNALLVDKSGESHKLKVLCLYRPPYSGN